MRTLPRHPRRAAEWRRAARRWPLLSLPPALRLYVLAVSATGGAAIGCAAAFTTWRPSDAVLSGVLLGLGAATVETIRRMGEPAGSHKDAHGVWELPAAVLLPPFYALAAPGLIFALAQWRVRRTLAYRRVFSGAALGLSDGAASLAFHAAWRPGLLPGTRAGLAGWVLTALAAGVLRYVLNNALVAVAVRLDDPAARLRDVIGGAEDLYHDAAELGVGIVVALAAAVTPVILLAALPCGILLQRSASHAQLLRASRTDAKTGLLTAAAWRTEAAVQVSLAVRTAAPLSVAMIDLDHFKQVNDTHGHLAGDAVLAGAAGAITAAMRDYDLAGRFGGEEFTVLLPQTTAGEALSVAGRLRARISTVTIPAARRHPTHITASIGVAALTGTITDLTDLLAAADAALYQAKQSGRDTVRLAPTDPDGRSDPHQEPAS